jgi:hypothetical protein
MHDAFWIKTTSKELSMRLNSRASAVAIAVAVAGLAAISGLAHAASNVGSNNASASLDFQVNIPGIVFLQVGTGEFRQDNPLVDTITFSPDAADILGAQPVAGTGGDLAGGRVTVRVWGNAGPLTLASTASALTNGTDTLPWSQIGVTASNAALPHPAFNADGTLSTPVTLQTLGGGNSPITNLSGDWTYSYLNATTPRRGQYAGRVTYTVSAP